MCNICGNKNHNEKIGYAFRVTENLTDESISICILKFFARRYSKTDKIGTFAFKVGIDYYERCTKKKGVYPRPGEIVEINMI